MDAPTLLRYPERSKNPSSVLNFGVDYLKAARILYSHGYKELTHKGPINHAAFHAVELFLKAVLLSTGATSERKLKKYHHYLAKMGAAVKELGVDLDSETLQFLEVMAPLGGGTRYLYERPNFVPDSELLIEYATKTYAVCAEYLKNNHDSDIIVIEWPELVSVHAY